MNYNFELNKIDLTINLRIFKFVNMKRLFLLLLIGISLTGYTKEEIKNIKNKESNKYAYGLNIYQQETSINIIFVDSAASGANNGTNWTNAFTSFQSALNAARSGDTIWVAKGTYYPSSGYGLCDNSGDSTRFYHFEMKEGVKIYGGFAGNEVPAIFNLNDRDFSTNRTILSGDLGTYGDSTDNCYHVFYHSSELNLTASAVLDGFTITGGNADGVSPHNAGGGMYNESSSPNFTNVTIFYNSASVGGGVYNLSSSPTLTNVTISKNSSKGGGGMYNYSSSSPTLNNVTISGNTTIGFGGGMYNYSSSSPILTNVTISGNTARFSGGGMFNYSSSSPTLTNVIVCGNTTTSGGGGIMNYSSSSPILNNVTISGNRADEGGAIYNGDHSSSKFNNSIIWGNYASTSGNELYIESGDSALLNYCCYKNNSNDVYDGGETFTATNHNITINPRFANPTNGDYRLCNTSPCLDAGIDSCNSELYDIRGVGFGRKLLKTESSQIGTIDMGAYEYKNGVDPLLRANKIFYVDSSASGTNNGNSWIDAFTSLQSALGAAISGDTIWVAKGTYYPSSGYNLCDNSGDSTRYYHFEMKEDVKIHGGFAGIEDPAVFNLNDRDFITNNTILSGDIGTRGDSTDNCYHIFYHSTGLYLTTSAVLDGFTITGGNADINVGGLNAHKNGGGMYNEYCSPSLTNVTMIKNTASIGGGMYNKSSSPTLTNVTICKNSAINAGGGIYNQSLSSPTLINVVINENSANYGGGIYSIDESSPTLTNVVISGNTAGEQGGGILNNWNDLSTLTNVVISGNSATSGGGMFNYYSSLMLTNVTMSKNTAQNGGGLYNTEEAYLTLNNSIVWGNSASSSGNEFYNEINNEVALNYSCYQNDSGDVYNAGTFTATNHNITLNPGFANLTNGDYRLCSISPCIDAGYDDYNNESYDIRGVGFGRKLLKTDSAQTGPIDMGAYEYKNEINSDLLNCGPGFTIADIDGNVYETVQIGLTCWTKQNMKTTRYANGDFIRFAEGYYAPDYPNEAENIQRFGRLYSWYSAVGVTENSTEIPTADPNHHIQGICPNGWYLPDDNIFEELLAWESSALRSDSLWLNGLNGTNYSGFNALPAGLYNVANGKYCFLLGNTFFMLNFNVIVLILYSMQPIKETAIAFAV